MRSRTETDSTRKGDLIAKTRSDNEAENPKERCFLTRKGGQMGEAGEHPPKPTNWRSTTMKRSLTELRLNRRDQLRTVHGLEDSGNEANGKAARQLAKECRQERGNKGDPNSHRTKCQNVTKRENGVERLGGHQLRGARSNQTTRLAKSKPYCIITLLHALGQF